MCGSLFLFIQTPYYICNIKVNIYLVALLVTLMEEPRSFRFFICMGEIGTSFFVVKKLPYMWYPNPGSCSFRTVCGMRERYLRGMLGFFSRSRHYFDFDWRTIFYFQYSNTGSCSLERSAEWGGKNYGACYDFPRMNALIPISTDGLFSVTRSLFIIGGRKFSRKIFFLNDLVVRAGENYTNSFMS